MSHSGQVFSNPATGQEIRILQTAEDTDGELLEVESVLPPHAPEPPAHYHPQQDERFEVLAGEVVVTLGGERRRYGPGEAFSVPAGTVHEMSNDGDEEARLRWETRPALRTEQFFESVGELWQSGKLNRKGMPNPLRMAALVNGFTDELRLASPPWPVQRVVLPVLAVGGRALR
jgi:quercetin dioxygenase-like cupin family protein